MDQVTINTGNTGPMAPGQEVPSEQNPTGLKNVGAAPEQPQETPQSDRPAWLPEGFESPEALAKAYQELTGKAKSEEAPTEEQPTPDNIGALTKFSEEFMKTGKLADSSYEELTKMGYPRTIVDEFIEGQKARMSMEEQKIMSEIGGADQYKAMTEWAGRNMTEAEVNAYNKAVESGDINQAMFAVKGLQARFQAAVGKGEPRLVQGTKAAPSGFRSVDEVVRAMSDPRYKTDPAYRADVEQKIGASNVL
jgi:hypothetical protein